MHGTLNRYLFEVLIEGIALQRSKLRVLGMTLALSGYLKREWSERGATRVESVPVFFFLFGIRGSTLRFTSLTWLLKSFKRSRFIAKRGEGRNV